MIAIVGPTASGKTELGLRLARERGGEIISFDSRQVYRYLSVGTAKPTGEWVSTRRSPPNAPIGGPGSLNTAPHPAPSPLRGEGGGEGGSVYLVHGIPYHLVDMWDPGTAFSAADFVQLAAQKVAEIRSRNKIPIFVGGTGLYLKAYLEGLAPLPPRDEALRARYRALAETKGRQALYAELSKVDPAAAARIPVNNIARVIRALEVYHLTGKPISQWHREHQDALLSSSPLAGEEGGGGVNILSAPPILHLPPQGGKELEILGLSLSREELHERIARRCRGMLDNGLVEETESLLKKGCAPDCPALTGLGYPRVVAHLKGRLSKAELLEHIIRDTRQYAKRQMTWFRHQLKVEWNPALTFASPLASRSPDFLRTGHARSDWSKT